MKLYLGDVVKIGGRLARTIGSRPSQSRHECGQEYWGSRFFVVEFLDNRERLSGVHWEDMTLIDHPDNMVQCVSRAGWASVDEYYDFMRTARHPNSFKPIARREQDRVYLKEDCIIER